MSFLLWGGGGCDPVCNGAGGGLPRGDVCPGVSTNPPQDRYPPPTATEAGGPHPTGMQHSCLLYKRFIADGASDSCRDLLNRKPSFWHMSAPSWTRKVVVEENLHFEPFLCLVGTSHKVKIPLHTPTMPLAPLQDPWQRVEIHQDRDVSSKALDFFFLSKLSINFFTSSWDLLSNNVSCLP